MPVSSYVLRCRQEDQDGILENLTDVGDFMIGERTEDGMAVAVATDDRRSSEQVGQELSELPGVRAAILVYHSFEDVAVADRSLVEA